MKRFWALLVLIGLNACSTGGDVGTSVGNPSVPTANVMPAFSTAIPESSLGADLDLSGEVSANVSDDEDVAPGDPSAEWEAVFLQGGVGDVRVQRDNLERFGQAVAAALEAAGIDTVSGTPQSVALAEMALINTTAAWEVEIVEDADPTYVRMYFTNAETGHIQATYLVQADADGNAARGLFAYVDSETLSADATAGKRLAALAFDFSDPAQNLLTMRVDQFHNGQGNFYVYHVHYECDTATNACIGEYLDIQSPEPERDFGAHNLRFSWDDDTSDVCIAYVTYTDEIAVGETDGFTGPETPDPSEVTHGECALEVPFWGEHVYTEADLPTRYLDTTPEGGTALDYFTDGSSKEGWDGLTPDLIETWLDASAFE